MEQKAIWYKLPPRFIQDCHECGCDVGEYYRGFLNATNPQLSELRSRAIHYADGGTDNPPPGLVVAAKALLRAMDKLSIGREADVSQ